MKGLIRKVTAFLLAITLMLPIANNKDEKSNCNAFDAEDVHLIFNSVNTFYYFSLALLLGTWGLSNLFSFIRSARDVWAPTSQVIDNWVFWFKNKGIDLDKYKQLLARVEKRLRTELVGQDEAIDQILNILIGYFESVIEAEVLGKKFERGLLLYCIGSPGTGKTVAMKIIAEEMGLKPYTARMSDVVEDKGNNANSVISRLAKPVIQDTGGTKVAVDSDLTRHLKSGVPTIYFFDEFEKMRKLDIILRKTEEKDNDGKIINGSADEAIRNFVDSGIFNGYNSFGSVIIVSSNETLEEIDQLESSTANRYKNALVHFKDLNKEDYKEIIRRNMAGPKQRYKNEFNLDNIIWNEPALDHIAEQFEQENTGGRAADLLMTHVRSALKTYRDKNNIDDFENKTLTLNYDFANNKIFAE